MTLNYKNDDSRESTLHLWNVHPFENKWEKELKFRGNVYDILEVKEKELIIVPYIDVTPENKYLRDDGVLLINSSTFQIVSNIKHDDVGANNLVSTIAFLICALITHCFNLIVIEY